MKFLNGGFKCWLQTFAAVILIINLINMSVVKCCSTSISSLPNKNDIKKINIEPLPNITPPPNIAPRKL